MWRAPPTSPNQSSLPLNTDPPWLASVLRDPSTTFSLLRLHPPSSLPTLVSPCSHLSLLSSLPLLDTRLSPFSSHAPPLTPLLSRPSSHARRSPYCQVSTCRMCTVTAPETVVRIMAGSHVIRVHVTSIDPLFHQACFFQFRKWQMPGAGKRPESCELSHGLNSS